MFSIPGSPFPIQEVVQPGYTGIDPVHCVNVKSAFGGLSTSSVLEQPWMITPQSETVPTNKALDDRPMGLTQTELEWWCDVATKPTDCNYRNPDVPSRSRLCYWDTTLKKCTLRVVLQSDYKKYAAGKAFFSKDKHPVIYPSCFLWVPGIDAVSECVSSRRFTG